MSLGDFPRRLVESRIGVRKSWFCNLSFQIMSADEKTPLINTGGDPKPSGTVTTAGGIFNVTNSIIGGGILALPSAFMAAGVVLGTYIVF